MIIKKYWCNKNSKINKRLLGMCSDVVKLLVENKKCKKGKNNNSCNNSCSYTAHYYSLDLTLFHSTQAWRSWLFPLHIRTFMAPWEWVCLMCASVCVHVCLKRARQNRRSCTASADCEIEKVCSQLSIKRVSQCK